MATKVVSLRKELIAKVGERIERAQTLILLGSMLRRKTVCFVEGRMLHAEFKTETEARECQRLIIAATKRSRAEYLA